MEGEDFSSWYERERAPLVRTLWAITGDPDAAVDVVDEAFARALARWSRVGEMS